MLGVNNTVSLLPIMSGLLKFTKPKTWAFSLIDWKLIRAIFREIFDLLMCDDFFLAGVDVFVGVAIVSSV